MLGATLRGFEKKKTLKVYEKWKEPQVFLPKKGYNCRKKKQGITLSRPDRQKQRKETFLA